MQQRSLHTIQYTARSHAAKNTHRSCFRTFAQQPSASPTSTSITEEQQALLQSFWRSRGVQSEPHIAHLVDLAHAPAPPSAQPLAELPGANAYWQAQGSADAAAHVTSVSQRVLKLAAVLGGYSSGVDLPWMLTKEPRLVAADVDEITRRLLEMKVATADQGIDIVALVETQPSLLLERSGQVDASVLQAAVQAWQHGVASDSGSDWDRYVEMLRAYVQEHGDAHVGARDGDDAELVRWATKQRKEHARGELDDGRVAVLVGIGFEFDAAQAEWQRWYNELAQQQTSGAPPLASGTAFLLTNWYVCVLLVVVVVVREASGSVLCSSDVVFDGRCFWVCGKNTCKTCSKCVCLHTPSQPPHRCSVQRIARRSGVLNEQRVEQLEGIGFDWTGADALS